ncbi:hypothetical protein [Liquorilactobacillus hordei]|uniref:hypothetical protein n=1 Tax=Liquorilactobacillus hordei TaxID=468911 RepID=UPI0012ED7235|nr:hypothetical protein [Liquorilactobacillus hordei]QYH52368.1 hypothetical protein G6O70_07935 [Liquorilactobacillus hordei DSM 19519]
MNNAKIALAGIREHIGKIKILAINNGLHIAVQQHPNVLQKIILNMAIKYLEKKQHRV